LKVFGEEIRKEDSGSSGGGSIEMDLNLTGSLVTNVSLIQPSSSAVDALSALLNSQLLGVAIGGLITFFTTFSIEKRKSRAKTVAQKTI
jgi:hypothetical protein